MDKFRLFCRANLVIFDLIGRRILLLASALIMICSLYGLGLYFWMLQNNPEEAASISFLPLACMCLFIAAFSLGFGPIPWLMMSELFAPEVKGVTSSISGNYAYLLIYNPKYSKMRSIENKDLAKI